MRTADDRPVVVAYDGSAEAQIALRQAAALCTDRSLLVASLGTRPAAGLS